MIISKTLKVYTLGNMVVFEDTTVGFLQGIPKGSARVLPFQSPDVGFRFVDLRTNTTLAQIADYAQIQDEAGAALGATFADVLYNLMLILDCSCDGTSGGGSGATLGGWVFVTRKADLPAAVANIITLEDEKTYVFTQDIDLTGDRLVSGQNTTLIGGSSENCFITSTGLLAATPLITSNWSMPMRNLSITHGTAFDLDATGNPNQALDWLGVNFTNCAAVGTVKGYTNFIMTDSAFIESAGLIFDGTVGTIGFLQCIFDIATGGTMITVPATAIISRRIRLTYCAMIATAGETALNVSIAASIPVEGYFLDTVNFSGGGTYLVGVQHTDNKAAFSTCRGIDNSGSIAQYYMQGNLTATVIGATNTFVKTAGTTSSGTYVEKFTLTANRATYAGALIGFFKVTAVLTLSSANNNVISARIGKTGTPTTSSETSVTTDAAGRVENCTCQDVVSLSTGDYIEVFVANRTATNNITVENLSVIIERLN